MNMSDLIRKRRSVRTFDGTPLRKEDAEAILAFASKVENPFDLPIEWKLLDGKKEGLSSPVIAGTDTFIAGKMPETDRAEEAFGYTFEKVVLFAESLGVGTTWIAGTMDRKAFELAVGLKEGEVMPCISPLGYPAPKMSLRETLMRKGVKADTRIDFEKLFFDGDFEKGLTSENAGELALPLQMVRLAPSAVNAQPWRLLVCGDCVHFYEKRSRGLSANGWDIQKIDMGIALSHFEAGAAECGLRPVLFVEDPCIPNNEGLTYIASYRIR
ncbi:MAG: nitroreductase [Lachnospiraceae bacterium]|nr:nitroreductase [Lachnospiraceae bacterium]